MALIRDELLHHFSWILIHRHHISSSIHHTLFKSVFVLSNLVHINFRNDHVKFFCTQVIEDFLKTRYEQTSISDQQTVKSFIARCLQLQVIIDLINNSLIDINSKNEAYFLLQII